MLPILKSTRSTSLDNLRVEEIVVPPAPQKPPYVALYEYYKLAYAETLYRWGLLYNRAEVCINTPERFVIIVFDIDYFR